MINGAVGFFIGIYLVLVLWRGQEGNLINLVSSQVGFFKWAGAILTLNYIYNMVGGKGGDIIKGLTINAMIAMVLLNSKNLFNETGKILDSTKEQDTNDKSIVSKYFK